MMIRFVSVVVFVSITLPFLWLVVICLRLLNPMLVKLGMKNNVLLDIAQRLWGRAIVRLAGASVRVEGLANIPKNCPVIYMITHTSNLDGFVVIGSLPTTPKFVFKRELMWLNPPFGLLMYACGHIPINRSNRNSAVNSLNNAEYKLNFGNSVAIFPEGHRSETGELQEFKKGAFHLAKNSGAKILPVIVSGTYDLWPPKTFFPKRGVVKLRILPEVVNDKNLTVDELSAKVRGTIATELTSMKNESRNSSSGSQKPSFIPSLSTLSIFASILSYYFLEMSS